MNISLENLQYLLNEQKRLVIENLLGSTSYYNSENTNSEIRSLPINKELFTEKGMRTKFPNDIDILKKYDVK